MKKLIAVAGVLICTGVIGCGSSDTQMKPPPPQASSEARIKQIQDNPNMPQDAKDRAIGMIKGADKMYSKQPAPASNK
jgi:hypothetical protein